MTTYQSSPFQSLLQRLHADSVTADQPFFDRFETMSAAEQETLRSDHRQLYSLARDSYLAVGENFGRLLYLLARTSKARTIVEFGTSFGISTLYLAAALRDNGGGRLITCEMEPTKSQRAQANLTEAGLGDLVEFRVGDALQLLGHDLPPVDLLLLDGAKPLYLPVLRLVEPFLAKNALIASDNINERQKIADFTAYLRDPSNGYLSLPLPLDDGIELSTRL